VLYSQINISSASGLNIAMESSDLSNAAALKMGWRITSTPDNCDQNAPPWLVPA